MRILSKIAAGSTVIIRDYNVYESTETIDVGFECSQLATNNR